ncbi:MAG: hypothetical protein J6Y37_13565 [Paludibacteraceae bacterium]|nr:hypothetical protein [Paludibacteraceae bacterium]
MGNKQTEYAKCYKDKSRVYFIENFLHTFNAMERKEVPFKLFPRQKAFMSSCAEYNNTIVRKHRQSGVTTLSAAFACGQCVFTSKKSPETILCIANKLEQAQELASMIMYFIDQVPRWMWGGDYYSPDPSNPNNVKSIYKKKNKGFIELFNGCKIYARASSPHAARGIPAVTILILDEAAFIKDGPATFTSAIAAQSTVVNSKCIMISTPHGKDQLYYKTYYNAIRGENNFHVVEFKWYQDPRYNRNLKWYRLVEETGEYEWDNDPVIDKLGNIRYNDERWSKLIKDGWTPTSPWFVDTCQSMNNDEQLIAQEILLSFLGSSDNVVQPEVIQAQESANVIKIDDSWPLKDPLIKETWIWKDPVPGHRYICACDPTSGSGEDRTSIEILDVDAIDENGIPCVEQVLEYNGKMTSDEIGGMIYEYARSYNNALVVVECIGGYGDATVLTLQSMRYENLYYDKPQLKTYTALTTYNKFKANDDDDLPGFRSNGLRIPMINTFVTMLKDNTLRIHSMRVIAELETWVFKNGRPDHMDGSHDDNLLCLSLATFVMQYYMLTMDRGRTKDLSIVRSWRVNNANTQTLASDRHGNTINMSDSKKMPFYSRTQIMKKRERRISAMLMLGGFRNPSVTATS